MYGALIRYMRDKKKPSSKIQSRAATKNIVLQVQRKRMFQLPMFKTLKT